MYLQNRKLNYILRSYFSIRDHILASEQNKKEHLFSQLTENSEVLGVQVDIEVVNLL